MSRTLCEEVRHEEVVRHSRFIARAASCRDEDEAQAFIERISDPAATHNCWAFKAGDRYRFNDDGEPGGTAGRPILQAIEGRDMDFVVVVVTRHFGGIKLGTGGLARAYGGTAAEVLRTAPSKPIVQRVRLRARLPFEHIGAAHQAMEAHSVEKIEETYNPEGVELIVTVPEGRRSAFTDTLRDLASGDVTVRRI